MSIQWMLALAALVSHRTTQGLVVCSMESLLCKRLASQLNCTKVN